MSRLPLRTRSVETLEARRFLATAFSAILQPLNGSGVTGMAELRLDGDLLIVEIVAQALEPFAVHQQHIHGRFADAAGEGSARVARDSVVPTNANDTDGDGFIEYDEGVAAYGQIILPLTAAPAEGTLADDRAIAQQFPTARDGRIKFIQSYDLGNDAQFFDPASGADFTGNDLLPLDARTIVIYGTSVAADAGAGTGGDVSGKGGYAPMLPVAVGTIEPMDDAAGEEAVDFGNAAGFFGDEDFNNDGIYQTYPEATTERPFDAVMTGRDAVYDNEVGFFLTDRDGIVDGLTPDQPGWAEAALRSPSRQVLFESGSGAGAVGTAMLDASDNVAFYLTQNSRADDFLADNPSNDLNADAPTPLFSIARANPDGLSHLRLFEVENGLTEFRWEDLTGLGDADFDDVVFTMDIDDAGPDMPGQA